MEIQGQGRCLSSAGGGWVLVRALLWVEESPLFMISKTIKVDCALEGGTFLMSTF